MEKEKAPGYDSGLVFPSKTGGYRFLSLMDKPFAAICKAAGINKKLSSKVFRRTFNRLMRRAKVDESVKLAIIGHAGSEVNRRYEHIDVSNKHLALASVRGLSAVSSPNDEVGKKRGETALEP